MDIDTTVDQEKIINKNIELQANPKKTISFLSGQLIIFLFSLGLLFFLIYKIGFQTIIEIISRIGWGILIIIALNGIRHVLRALSIYFTIPPQHRLFKFRHAMAARLGGEAVSVITFTGPILGDATKVALLKRNLPLSHGGAAVVADNILYYISVLVMVLTGIGIMSFAYSNSAMMKYVLIGIATFDLFIFVGMGLLIWYQIKPISWLIKKFSNHLPNFILKGQDGIYELESNGYRFYENRRLVFFIIFGLNFLAHFLSVCEVYIALQMLGSPSTAMNAFIIESLTKVINLVFSFVPGTVGFYEGGNGVILSALGFTTATGVALALVRRGAILFWTLIGLMILLWRSISHRTKNSSELIYKSQI